jgi:hypothetical protein
LCYILISAFRAWYGHITTNVLALIQGRGQEEEEDGFDADDAQIVTNENEGDGSAKHSNEQVCHQPHPLHQP